MKLVTRLLGVWTGFVLLFFYLPIAVLVLFSFNQSKLNIVWTGFTLDWYGSLWRDTVLVRALAEQPDRRGLHHADLPRARNRRGLAAVSLPLPGGFGARDARVPSDDRPGSDPRREPADPVRDDRAPARLHDDRDLARDLLLPVRDGLRPGPPRRTRSRPRGSGARSRRDAAAGLHEGAGALPDARDRLGRADVVHALARRTDRHLLHGQRGHADAAARDLRAREEGTRPVAQCDLDGVHRR